MVQAITMYICIAREWQLLNRKIRIICCATQTHTMHVMNHRKICFFPELFRASREIHLCGSVPLYAQLKVIQSI